MTIVFCHPLPPYLCLSIILYVIADNCSFHDRHKYIHEPLLVPLACSPSGRRAFQSLASPPTPLTQALKMVDLDAIRFANPFTYLSKDMEGPYIVRAMLRGPSFTGEKGAANLRRLGYTPAVVTGIFGKTEHTPIAIEAKHFERLHRHLGDTLGCTPIRLAFDFELPTLREEGEGNGAGDVSSSSPFAPQVLAHMVRTKSKGKDWSVRTPVAVRFKFIPSHCPLRARIPVRLVGRDANPAKMRVWLTHHPTLTVEASSPAALRNAIEVDVSGDDDQACHRLSDVAERLPEGLRLVGYRDMRQPVVRVAGRKQFGGGNDNPLSNKR